MTAGSSDVTALHGAVYTPDGLASVQIGDVTDAESAHAGASSLIAQLSALTE